MTERIRITFVEEYVKKVPLNFPHFPLFTLWLKSDLELEERDAEGTGTRITDATKHQSAAFKHLNTPTTT